jgi:hypothetical protein
VALGAGILFGLITMLVQYVGLFMTGFHTGLFTGAAVLSALEEVRRGPGGTRGPGGSAWTAAGVLLGSGLLLAVLNLRWRKGLTVAGTAVYGGAIIATSLDYFVEKFATVQWFWARVALKTRHAPPPPCWFGWAILAVWPLVVVAGVVTQWAVTGRGIHHHESECLSTTFIDVTVTSAAMPRGVVRQHAKIRPAHACAGEGEPGAGGGSQRKECPSRNKSFHEEKQLYSVIAVQTVSTRLRHSQVP